MVFLNISLVLKLLLLFVLLLIASPISAFDNTPRIRKMAEKPNKPLKPFTADSPWDGNYNIP